MMIGNLVGQRPISPYIMATWHFSCLGMTMEKSIGRKLKPSVVHLHCALQHFGAEVRTLLCFFTWGAFIGSQHYWTKKVGCLPLGSGLHPNGYGYGEGPTGSSLLDTGRCSTPQVYPAICSCYTARLLATMGYDF